MMYHLDPSKQETAISLATTLDKDIEGVNLQVSTLFGRFMVTSYNYANGAHKLLLGS
jgi:hypothetical protein